jgi:hypothetical protein
MKKKSTKLMGSFLLGAALMAQGAFAEEAADPAQTAAEAVQANADETVKEQTAAGWIDMPAEKQYRIYSQQSDQSAGQSAWLNLPKEKEYVILNATETVSAPNVWITAPVEDQFVIVQAKPETDAQKSWVILPKEDEFQVIAEQPGESVARSGWVTAPVEDEFVVVGEDENDAKDMGSRPVWKWNAPATDSKD